jgi:hypothetical protein
MLLCRSWRCFVWTSYKEGFTGECNLKVLNEEFKVELKTEKFVYAILDL